MTFVEKVKEALFERLARVELTAKKKPEESCNGHYPVMTYSNIDKHTIVTVFLENHQIEFSTTIGPAKLVQGPMTGREARIDMFINDLNRFEETARRAKGL